MGAVDSTSVDKDQHMMWYTDAPIITKEGRDTLGFLIHPFFISLGADVATNLIYHGVDLDRKHTQLIVIPNFLNKLLEPLMQLKTI